MRVSVRSAIAAALAFGFCFLLPGSPALAQASQTTIGPVTLAWRKGWSYAGNTLHFFGSVAMTSATFDLHAEDLKITLASGKKASPASVAKAVADGGTSGQVTGRFEQVAEGRTFRLKADHAVYVPDSSRPGGGKIDFTGHVQWIIAAPQALAEPSVTTMEHATVLLGKGSDYPRFEGDAGQMTLTPLH